MSSIASVSHKFNFKIVHNIPECNVIFLIHCLFIKMFSKVDSSFSFYSQMKSTCFDHKVSIQTEWKKSFHEKGRKGKKTFGFRAWKMMFFGLWSDCVWCFAVLLHCQNVHKTQSIADETMKWSVSSSSLHYDEKRKNKLFFYFYQHEAYFITFFLAFCCELFYVLQKVTSRKTFSCFPQMTKRSEKINEVVNFNWLLNQKTI